MAEFEYISNSEIQELLTEASRNLLNEKSYTTLPKIEQIYLLCSIFQQQIQLAKNNSDERILEMTYSLGMRIVYQTRSFLLNENMLFSIGSESPLGNLQHKLISQEKIFGMIELDLKYKVIRLNTELESFKNIESTNLEKWEAQLWPKVKEAAYFDWRGKGKHKKNKFGGNRFYYQSDESDINVWARYSGKYHNLYRYYNKNGKLMFFNEGWLYEWFSNYIQNEQRVEQLRNSFKENKGTPLAPLMESGKLENIKAYQGGDYIDALGRQIQAKKDNTKLISFYSIEKVIQDMMTSLLIYKTNLTIGVPNSSRKLAQEFTNIFTHKETINKDYDSIVDNILQNLIK